MIANRVRVKEFFQDMDPLNAGVVTKSQFVRCLSSLGISSLGKFNIRRGEVAALLDAFTDPTDPEKVSWKRFEFEVETAVNGLTPKSTAESDECRAAVNNLKTLVDQRRLNCWGPFKDFDK